MLGPVPRKAGDYMKVSLMDTHRPETAWPTHTITRDVAISF